MPERFSVRVAKEEMGFCAGHFISYEGDKCERLHGHNYRVAVDISGPLDDNYYVFDFMRSSGCAKPLRMNSTTACCCRPAIDSSGLKKSQTASASNTVIETGCSPHDCVLLPIENTTAELLARYIATRLQKSLVAEHSFQPERIRVEVEETPGQAATVEIH